MDGVRAASRCLHRGRFGSTRTSYDLHAHNRHRNDDHLSCSTVDVHNDHDSGAEHNDDRYDCSDP